MIMTAEMSDLDSNTHGDSVAILWWALLYYIVLIISKDKFGLMDRLQIFTVVMGSVRHFFPIISRPFDAVAVAVKKDKPP
ncbi:hypothetical protein SOVF_064850 [Spinacia oleracea]|nr:hypothetical protein SOVF_064850 [Spinacia oleracea]